MADAHHDTVAAVVACSHYDAVGGSVNDRARGGGRQIDACVAAVVQAIHVVALASRGIARGVETLRNEVAISVIRIPGGLH